VEEMEVSGEKGSRKTKENLDNTVKRNLELIGVKEYGIGGRWRKIIVKPTLLEGKMWTLNDNHDE